MSINARMSAKALQTMLRQTKSKLAKKKNVAAKHRDGTAYRTRANREIAALESKINEIKRAIEDKQ